ncbi:MAG: hypothetical protein ACI8S3_001815, partial [Alphaproteobacteria bacterium]
MQESGQDALPSILDDKVFLAMSHPGWGTRLLSMGLLIN